MSTHGDIYAIFLLSMVSHHVINGLGSGLHVGFQGNTERFTNNKTLRKTK